MAYSFGNNTLVLQMKEASASGDREQLAALLWHGLEPVIDTELRREEFGMFNAEDRKDAKQEAWLYVLDRLEPFLSNPLNDPRCESADRYPPARRQRWAHDMVVLSLRQTRDRIKKHAKSPGIQKGESFDVYSLDQSMNEESSATRMDFIPASHAAPDEALLRRERMTQACRAFFDLKNSPELLTAVGFVILSESLTRTHRSLDAYADLLNGMPAVRVVAAIERIMDEFDIDPAALDGLKKRLAGDKTRVVDNLTAKSLANRKNSMLSALRSAPTDEEDNP